MKVSDRSFQSFSSRRQQKIQYEITQVNPNEFDLHYQNLSSFTVNIFSWFSFLFSVCVHFVRTSIVQYCVPSYIAYLVIMIFTYKSKIIYIVNVSKICSLIIPYQMVLRIHFHIKIDAQYALKLKVLWKITVYGCNSPETDHFRQLCLFTLTKVSDRSLI